jgi:hypothetical protein
VGTKTSLALLLDERSSTPLLALLAAVVLLVAEECSRCLAYCVGLPAKTEDSVCYKAEKQRKGKNPNSKAAKTKSNQNRGLCLVVAMREWRCKAKQLPQRYRIRDSCTHTMYGCISAHTQRCAISHARIRKCAELQLLEFSKTRTSLNHNERALRTLKLARTLVWIQFRALRDCECCSVQGCRAV